MIPIRVVNLLLATIRLPPLNKQQKGLKENAKQKKRTGRQKQQATTLYLNYCHH
jgi:hypothetical protein